MPAVLFYVQHLLGIGHLMRARVIAEALADAGCDVHLVTGGRPFGGREARGVRTVQLPAIHVSDPGMKPLRDANGQPIDDAYRERRRSLLLAEFDAIAPDAVLFETFPFGRRALHFELLPLLDRIEATRPRPLVVASVRDILQRRTNQDREREMLALARRAFDAILVHGDRRFMRLDETFPLAPELAIPVHYTGFVAASSAGAASSRSGERNEVIVSAGGGAVGFGLLRAAIRARRDSCMSGIPWRLLAGTNATDAELEHLTRGAGPGVIVERARADFAALLAQASISVSQAGYNTVLDVVRSGARPVLVPYAEHGETEQRTRAERLRELNLALVVDAAEISGPVLSDAIDAAAAKKDWARWDFDCDGAAHSAALVVEMVERHRVRRVGASA
jgi:predicted glycosyltransferase